MVDVLAEPNQTKTDTSLRTLAAISTAHWVSHFHMFVLPMLFPFLKAQLGVGYIELGFALTVFGLVSGLTQAPIGYLADHICARKLLLMSLPDASAADRRADGVQAPQQNVLTPAIMMLTIFFMLLGLSNAGINNFGV